MVDQDNPKTRELPTDVEAFVAECEERFADENKVFSEDRIPRLFAIIRAQGAGNAALRDRLAKLENAAHSACEPYPELHAGTDHHGTIETLRVILESKGSDNGTT